MYEREIDQKSDVAAAAISSLGAESSENIRISGDSPGEQSTDCSSGCSVVGINGTECLTTTVAVGSEEIRVSPVLDCRESEASVEVRVLDGEVRDLHSNVRNDGSDVGNVEAEKADSAEERISSEIDTISLDGKMDARVSVVMDEDLPGFVVRNSGMVEHLMTGTEEVARLSSGETKENAEGTEERTVSDFDFSNSKLDEGAATEMPEALGAEAAWALSYGFEAGDMVWGKVKSHPWWPGHIFNEAFASPSVRRTKREGYVLVAFFGDSSYGWFDPAELIHFESHYAEKSRQTNSRNFIKAVEDAVDEVRRRRALGFACLCRNPFNFRPTNVQGYFAVDVCDYEPGAVYSVKQIKTARDSFQPADLLSFVQQLALMPRNSEQRGIDWIKNMATVRAYRKAVFEEFDETYAQAFGMQPVRPSRDSMGVLDQYAKMPSRAPLSGPLVIAEALGKRKSSTKPIKVKEQSKKDKYMLKRREEPTDPRAHYISQGQATVSVLPAFKEGAAALSAGDCVFQKGVPVVSMKPVASGKVGAGTTSGVGEAPRQDGIGQKDKYVDKNQVVSKFSLVDAQVNTSQVVLPTGFVVSLPISQPQTPRTDSCTPVVQGGHEDAKPPLGEETSALQEMKGGVRSDVAVGPMSTGMHGSDLLGKSELPGVIDSFDQTFQQEGEAMVGSKYEESVKLSCTFEGLEQPKMRLSTPVENCHGLDQKEGGNSTLPLPIDAKLPGQVLGMDIDSIGKKAAFPKQPVKELSSEKSIMGEKKKKKKELSSEKSIMGEKKKKKKELSSEKSIMGEKKKKKKKESGLETRLDHPQKRLKTVKGGESVSKSARKSIGIGLIPRENIHGDPQREVDGTGSTFDSSSLLTPPVVDMGNIEVELPQLVDDLLSLALDPFHGVQRNRPAIVRQVFLRFRSLVYQKSLVLAPPTEAEAESSDIHGNKSPPTTDAAEILPIEDDVIDHVTASKPPKQLFRPDDPTKAGRKRSLSDRQGEMSAKKLKKLNERKSIAAEKKAGNLKTPEMQQERKDMGMAVSGKSIKPESVKKLEPPVRVVEPTMLIMKFPPRTTLPSIPELKARFARFGPLDHSATRVFWKSFTCRVVFKHKSHAQAALNYAVRNTSLFGHVKVNYHLRELEVPAQKLPDTGKRWADDASDEATQFRASGMNDSGGEPKQTAFLQRPPQPAVQLKSCLKKPSGDEAGPPPGVPRESPRVKFMLGGEESSRGEQLVVSSSNHNNGNNADGGSTSLAMDVNTKNFQKVIPSLPPILPLPSRIPDVHENRGVDHFPNSHYVHYSEVGPRNNPNFFNVKNNVDISHQLLSLLMRCSDIVTDVKSSLGYVPYHPL